MLMNRAIAIYAGIIVTVLFSSLGLVFIPQVQIGRLQPYKDDQGNVYPQPLFGAAAEGRKVYIDLGCIYCHSQQVMSERFKSDEARGWGNRPSVSRDYIYDVPPLMGTMRTGPDLMNVGERLPNATWHYQHLYNPRITSPGSIMPPFPFLFEKHTLKQDEDMPADAITVPEPWLKPDEYLVPTERGRALVAYLLAMKHDTPLPEAPAQ